MRYAIVSDIHANLDALHAVLEDAGDVPLLCLGDIVGYGAQPNECVDIIRNRAVHTVLGNHDLACGDGTGIDHMNSDPAKSAFWTHRRLSDANIDFLLALPYTVKTPTFALVHSSLNHPENFTYVDDVYEAEEAFAACDDIITFIEEPVMKQMAQSAAVRNPASPTWSESASGRPTHAASSALMEKASMPIDGRT